ncbi:MAG: carboxypeptidase regulatory-like domain-containing protein [Gemmatimonadaceae bacterium]|nr:carboxypeptidase regulatory-like domain-containing protein [Gemmatimonadaceae bacterium]
MAPSLTGAPGRIVLLGLCCLSTTASAQVVAPRPAGPNTLSGLVVDSAGVPIPTATVYIVELKRQVTVRDNGAFRFDSVKAGAYTVGARAIGYISGTGKVTVGADGGAAIIEMVRVSFALPSMITNASRGGLSGVIGDTSFRAMAGVTVRVLGSGAGSTVTDSTGEFFLPVKPGNYMVRLERDGFGRQMIGVTVPEKEGRRIAAWMAPRSEQTNPMEAMHLFDLEQRLIRRGPVGSKLYTRESLARLNIPDAREAAQRFLARPIRDGDADGCALINGGPQQAPLWSISAEDIELLEVYDAPRARSAKTSLMNNPTIAAMGSGPGCRHTVWLRK